LTVVVDANVLVYCFVDRPLSAKVTSFVESHEGLIAPSVALVEVAHTLTKYVRTKAVEREYAEAAFQAARRLLNDIVPIERFMDRAVSLALKYNHTPADFLYVLLARDRDARMATADAKFVRKLRATEFSDQFIDLNVWRP
jgi:predicted nucleic acid-binding protein